jgi:hypothetical protein
MDANATDVNVDSSTTQDNQSFDNGQSQAGEPRSWTDLAADFFASEGVNSEDSELDPQEDQTSDYGDDESQAEDLPSQANKDKPVKEDKEEKNHSKGADKRIQQLVAQKKEAQTKQFETQRKLDETLAQLELYKQENNYYLDMLNSGKQVDEKDEMIRHYEAKSQWQAKQQEIERLHQQRLAEAEQAELQAEQNIRAQQEKHQIISGIKAAAQEYFDPDTGVHLVSPYEIGLAMEANPSLDARSAAKLLAQKREAAYSKRLQKPVAPKTASSVTSGTRDKREPDVWRGRDAVDFAADFFRQESKNKRGM